MITLRRFVLLAALLFWLGGFVFYTAVVVPIGTEELGSLQQGFITRRVTRTLNLSAAIALAVLLWDLLRHDPSAWRRRLRWSCWFGMVLALITLFYNHAYLDRLLDADTMTVRDRRAFYLAHRAYLWLSTVQWGFGVVFLLLLPAAWRAQDREEPTPGQRRLV
jgi:hypothetical protein